MDAFNSKHQLIGNVYRKLKIIDVVEPRVDSKGRLTQRVKVLCVCGQVKVVNLANLRSRKTSSCGCHKLKSDAYLRHQLSGYKTKARKRNLVWELPDEVALSLMQSNCYLCNAPPIERPYRTYKTKEAQARKCIANGIDRVDNSAGYTIKNSMACCSICNLMKLVYDKDTFLIHIDKIRSHQNTLTSAS